MTPISEKRFVQVGSATVDVGVWKNFGVQLDGLRVIGDGPVGLGRREHSLIAKKMAASLKWMRTPEESATTIWPLPRRPAMGKTLIQDFPSDWRKEVSQVILSSPMAIKEVGPVLGSNMSPLSQLLRSPPPCWFATNARPRGTMKGCLHRGAIYIAISCGYLVASPVLAQRVVEDCKVFKEEDCDWLHSEVLEACEKVAQCPDDPRSTELSMSNIRDLNSLETCMTARALSEVWDFCQAACLDKRRVGYPEFHKAVCAPLLKH